MNFLMKKLVLIILDGWGIAKNPLVSAIDKAYTPFINFCYKQYPNSKLLTSGLSVGLPDGQVGNSEVGHINLGAGRIIYQDLIKINIAIKNNSLFDNEIINKAINYAIIYKKKIHIIGLLSDGGVHSHINHLFHLLDILKNKKFKNVFIHAFTDGRDTNYKSGKIYLKTLLDYINYNNIGKLATVVGRYYAMDRDYRWLRIKKAYDVMVHGIGEHSINILNSIQESYDYGTTDEFINPIVMINSNKQPIARIANGDVVISFNFRSDRVRQITQILTQKNLLEYNMSKLNLYYITMTLYDKNFQNIYVLFNKENLSNTLGEVLDKHKKIHLRIAETEKYPHVTFFFSGGRENPFKNEKRILCPSPKVSTYDLKPEMSAKNIHDNVIFELKKQEADFICLNFANPDMVGHTGVMLATIKACEIIDEYTHSICRIALKNNYSILIVSDHGNADLMINPDKTPNTAHTMEPVPCILLEKTQNFILKNGKLSDVAPTILEIMSIPKPDIMTGVSLLSKKIT